MQKRLYLEMLGCVSDEGFSLDELVIRTKELFAREGMAGIVGLVLSLVDEELSLRLCSGESKRGPGECCSAPRYEPYNRSERRIRTSIGVVRLRWRRLRCKTCGKSIVPLRDFLMLEHYQSKDAELERMVAEVVSEQSYRRATHHFELIGEIPVPKSTAHRWVMRSNCDEVESKQGPFEFILGDGTGYKRCAYAGQNNRGEVRVVLGVDGDGRVSPIGAWSGRSWEEIGKEISSEKIAKVFVGDGEPGIADGLASLTNEAQRCHWHMVHDLDRFMWADGANKQLRRQTQKRTAAIIGIELPEEDVREVTPEDKEGLLERVQRAEEKLDDLIEELRLRRYKQAAGYIENAKKNLFTYVKFWLEYGMVSPRVSSMLERMMREIGRRLKKIAFGWSEFGAAKMTRIIIKRFTSAHQWDEYWQRRLRLNGNVILIYRGVSAV